MRLCVAQFLPGARSRVGLAASSTQKVAAGLTVSPGLSTDLRDWFPTSTLVGWVEQEVKRLTPDRGSQACSDNPLLVNERAAMFSVLALGLASRLFTSEEITQACRTEPVFQRLCGGKAPFPHELSRFRRQNRQVLERLLAAVFGQAIRRRFYLAIESLTPELQEDLRQYAAERLDLARHMDIGQDVCEVAS